MSEFEENDYQEEDDETSEAEEEKPKERTVTLSYEDAKRLRQAAKKGRRVDELEGKLALRDSKLSLTADQEEALFAIHKGPRTAEAIAETAQKLGWGTPAGASEEDAEAEKVISDATSTARPKLAEEGDPADLTVSAKQARVNLVAGVWDQARYEKYMRAKHPELVGSS